MSTTEKANYLLKPGQFNNALSKMMQKVNNKSKFNLSVSQLADGIYFMEIVTNEGILIKGIAIGK